MKKIAFSTDDGETISRHLGQAQFYILWMIAGPSRSKGVRNLAISTTRKRTPLEEKIIMPTAARPCSPRSWTARF